MDIHQGPIAHSLGCAIAMAILDLDCTEIGTKVEVEVRGRRIEARWWPCHSTKKQK